MPLSALARAKARGVGWLALGGIIASGCSDPSTAEALFWPLDSYGAGTGGSPMGGTTGGPTGGTPGASGGVPSTTGGTSAGSGMGGVGGSAGSGGAGGFGGFFASPNCSLSVKVTTATENGEYEPRNVGAIWLADDEAGKFIRTLEVWAEEREGDLPEWNTATEDANVPRSRVDIVSQATLDDHEAHTATWNCKDFEDMSIPDGIYRVYFEMTENDGGGPFRFETFTKGPAAVTLTPADDTHFKAIELSFKP